MFGKAVSERRKTIMADWVILGLISLASSSLAVMWLSPQRRRTDSSFGLLSPNSIFDAVFLFDGTRLVAHSDIALAGYENGAVELWRIDATREQLLEWAQTNRYIPDLTCNQRELYRLEPLCETEE